jgi:hypothetical protein
MVWWGGWRDENVLEFLTCSWASSKSQMAPTIGRCVNLSTKIRVSRIFSAGKKILRGRINTKGIKLYWTLECESKECTAHSPEGDRNA